MKNTAFNALLLGEIVSNFGSMLTRLVIPWIAALTLAATPFEMGLLVVADVATAAVTALLLGALVDRVSLRWMMMAADIGRAALIAALAWLVWQGAATFALLVAISAINGLLTVAFQLARSAWVAKHSTIDELTPRNSKLSAAGSATEALSFGVGGWLYQAVGGALSLATDAASYLLSLACVWRLPRDEMPPRDAFAPAVAIGWKVVVTDARSGMAVLLCNPTLKRLGWIEFFINLGTGMAGASYMIFVARDLGFSPGTLGMIFAVGGAGAVIAAAIAPWLGNRVGGPRAIIFGVAALAVGALVIIAAEGATLLAAALLVTHQLIGDGGRVMQEIHDRTLRQTLAPHDALARVDAGLRTVTHLGMLLGAVIGGLVGNVIGARLTLLLSALLLVVAAGVAYYGLWKTK